MRRAVYCIAIACTSLVGCLVVKEAPSSVDPNTSPDASDSVPVDAALGDAGVGGDARVGVCAAPHVFCDDFEQGTLQDAVARWGYSAQGAGLLSLAQQSGPAGSRALRVDVTPNKVETESVLSRSFSLTGRSHRMEFDQRLELPAPGAFKRIDTLNILLFPPPPGNVSHGINLQNTPSTSEINYFVERAGGGFDQAQTTMPSAKGTWRHVTILVPSVTPPSATVLVDGVLVVKIPIQGGVLSSLAFTIGAHTLDFETTTTVYVDNVIIVDD